jgi:hypothetical protein
MLYSIFSIFQSEVIVLIYYGPARLEPIPLFEKEGPGEIFGLLGGE